MKQHRRHDRSDKVTSDGQVDANSVIKTPVLGKLLPFKGTGSASEHDG